MLVLVLRGALAEIMRRWATIWDAGCVVVGWMGMGILDFVLVVLLLGARDGMVEVVSLMVVTPLATVEVEFGFCSCVWDWDWV